MTKRVLIIGGYGNFGRRIAEFLAPEPQCHLILGGRDMAKAAALTKNLAAANPPDAIRMDIHQGLKETLAQITPDIVIHTSGPYQGQNYNVARACIDNGSHYIDLADAREFVCNIGILHQQALEEGVLVCSGASSVPTLSAAIIDSQLQDFDSLDAVYYGISTAQKTGSGLATTSAVLSYAGKPFKTLIKGEMKDIYGWLDFSLRKFWQLNHRPLGNCDIPDLQLFPRMYPSLKTIRFQAGLEIKLIHAILFSLSWSVRLKIIPSLQPLAPKLLKLATLFNLIGSDDSGFFMELRDLDPSRRLLFEIVARSGDGLYIPCIPSVVLAKKLIKEEINIAGAFPCVGFVKLDEYLAMLKEFNIEWRLKSTT